MDRRVLLKDDLPILKKYLFFLKFCGVYLDGERNFKIVATVVSLFVAPGLVLMGYSMYLFIRDLDAIATIAHHSILLLDVAVAVPIYLYNRPKLLSMLQDMTKSHDYCSQIMAEYTDITLEKRIKKLNSIFNIVVASTIIMISNLIANAYLEQKWMNTEHMLLFPCWFPFDLDYIPNHIAAYLWELILVTFITLMAFGVMTVMSLAYDHMKSELKLLAYALEKNAERASELVNSNNKRPKGSLREAYITSIRHCGKHHVEITNYFQIANDVFSYMYLAGFLTGLVVCVCAGLALVSINMTIKIKFVVITIIQLVYFFILCWFGEEISAESEQIRLVIYGIQWYNMPKECQSTLCLMIERSLKPLTLTSASGHKADLDTFMSMIKASYSYFNMMLAAQT